MNCLSGRKEVNKVDNITKEFLRKCKEAGYEKVTIFVRNKNIPATKKIKDGDWFGQWAKNDDGEAIEVYKHKVVCGHPEQRDEKGWPKMWGIVKDCGLTAGLQMGGTGLGDAHDINRNLCEMLTAGYYELKNNKPSKGELK